MTAVWTFAILAALCFGGAWLLERAARGTDDFGYGILFWVAVALGVVFLFVGAVLWLVHLYASGFR